MLMNLLGDLDKGNPYAFNSMHMHKLTSTSQFQQMQRKCVWIQITL